MVSTARSAAQSAAAQQPMLAIVCSYLTGGALDDALRQVAVRSDRRKVVFEPVPPSRLTLKDPELRLLCSEQLSAFSWWGTKGEVAVLTHSGSGCDCSKLQPQLKSALGEFALALSGWRYGCRSAIVSAFEYNPGKPLRLNFSASTRPGWKPPLY